MEYAAGTKSSSSRGVIDKQAQERETQFILARQLDPLARATAHHGAAAFDASRAASILRAMAPQSARTRQSLLQLQRLVGNRSAQHLIRLARQGSGEVEAAPEVEEAIQRARGGGAALDNGVRVQMESAFGADFGGVRVHTNSQADTLNRALSARAFTTGRDIFFRDGEYDPASAGGRELLAHELTHVVQQTGAPLQAKLVVGEPNDLFEQEADQVAAQLMRMPESRPAFPSGVSHDALQRKCAECASGSGLCPDCAEEGTRLQRKPVLAGQRSAVGHVGSVNIVQRQVVTTEPAGGCGLCHGPMMAGRIAHQLIQEEFEILYPLGLVELPVSSPTDDDGRLDLAVAVPGGLEIGEIKPANPEGYINGAADMAFYITALRAIFPNQNIRPLTRVLPPEVTIFPNPQVPTCPLQTLFVNPPIDGVYGYYCRPSYSQLVGNPNCNCRRGGQRVPVPVPVPVPQTEGERERVRVRPPMPMPGPRPIPVASRSTYEEIKNFIERVVRSGENAEEAARRFLTEHPEVRNMLIGAAIVIVLATIGEDLLTLGLGIFDDPASFAVAYALVRVAQQAP